MITLENWRKIVDNPRLELEFLSRRVYAFLEDSQYITDHIRYHFVMMAVSQIGYVSQELSYVDGLLDNPQVSEYARWVAEGRKAAILPVIRTIREQLDELELKNIGEDNA